MDIKKHIETAAAEGRAERVFRNGIDWILVSELDGWISIVKIAEEQYIPTLQACDRDKALDYIEMVEPVPFHIERIV